MHCSIDLRMNYTKVIPFMIFISTQDHCLFGYLSISETFFYYGRIYSLEKSEIKTKMENLLNILKLQNIKSCIINLRYQDFYILGNLFSFKRTTRPYNCANINANLPWRLGWIQSPFETLGIHKLEELENPLRMMSQPDKSATYHL